MREAIAAPLIGPNGEDRSAPAPREANAGAGRRDFVGADESAPPPPPRREQAAGDGDGGSVSFFDQDGDSVEFALNDHGGIDYTGNGELLVSSLMSDRGSGIELDELSGGIRIAQKWLTAPREDEREQVLGELMALISRSETPADWLQVTRPFAPRHDVHEFLLGDDCAVLSLQECLRGVPGAALVEGCKDCFAVARELAGSSPGCDNTLAVLRNASAEEHVCSYTAGALWRATGSLWIESLTIAVGRSFTVATLVVFNHYLVEAFYPMLLDQTAPSRYLAMAVMALCVAKTALLRWLFPLLISRASLL